MREIKFRAWEEEGAGMIYPTKDKFNETSWGLVVAFDGSIISFNEDGDISYDTGKYHIIMQYTGLLDKNGVKIYEGDKLKICKPYDRVKQPWSDVCVTVEFRNGCWYCGKGKSLYNYSTISGATIEVIGNIHEHPELLNAS